MRMRLSPLLSAMLTRHVVAFERFNISSQTKRTPARNRSAREWGRALSGRADFAGPAGDLDGRKKACGQLRVGGTKKVPRVVNQPANL
jgi:hypothetical protein